MGKNSWLTLSSSRVSSSVIMMEGRDIVCAFSSNEVTESSSVREGKDMLSPFSIRGFWKKYIFSQVNKYEIFGL